MNPWPRIFLPYAAGYFLSYLLRNANAVIAPELVRELGLSASGLGLLTSAYLLAFGAFQLPLGILLDRFGPRRVEAALLLVAAAGSAAFATGRTLPQLAVARAAVGLGVSACLMASFKAFSVWFPPGRQASLNAAVMVAGGLGALTATSPLSAAVPLLGWRGVFLSLAGLAVVAAAGILSTPERAGARGGETLGQQLAALGGILRSGPFWRYAPPTTLFVGGFMALQGLWAVPWLMHVGGHAREAAAFHLLLTTLGMMGGFLAIALFIGSLERRGVHPDRVLVAGMVAGLLAVGSLLSGRGSTHVAWFVLGLVFATGNTAYAILTARFPATLAGRANTALNLAVFAGAFAIQWGYGAALDLLVARGWSLAAAHRAALAGLFALQAASFVGFLASGRRGRTPAGLIVVPLLLLATAGACARKLPPPSDPPPSRPAPGPRVALDVSLKGSVTIRGAPGHGPAVPYHRTRMGEVDAAVSDTGNALGDEAAFSCGTDGRDSASTAVAAVTPQRAPGSEAWGFALSANATARGGAFRPGVSPLCRAPRSTTASAAASAGAVLEVRCASDAPAVERVLVRTGGIPVTVTDLAGQRLPLEPLAGGHGQVVELAAPGAYAIAATVSVEASAAGGCPECAEVRSASGSVSVQRLGEAGAPPPPDPGARRFPVPVWIAVRDLEQALRTQLFEPRGGRYFPCDASQGCDEAASEIYVEEPHLDVQGNWIVLRLHVGGRGRWLFLRPGVSGDVTLYGVPQVKDGVVSLAGVRLDTSSEDALFRIASSLYASKLAATIEEKARVDVTPYLARAERELARHFPVRWNGACVLLDVGTPRLDGIVVTSAPDGIRADFSAGLRPIDPEGCAAAPAPAAPPPPAASGTGDR